MASFSRSARIMLKGRKLSPFSHYRYCKKYSAGLLNHTSYGIDSYRNVSALPAAVQVNYPSVTPRWPPGTWGVLDEEAAWKYYEKGVEIEDTLCLWEKLKKLTAEQRYFFNMHAFKANSPPRILPFQKYLTKTNLIVDSRLPGMYENVDTETGFDVVKAVVIEHLIKEQARLNDKFERIRKDPTSVLCEDAIIKEMSEQLITAVINVLFHVLNGKHEHLHGGQADYHPTHKAFWCVGGFGEEFENRTDEGFIHVQYSHQPAIAIRTDEPLPAVIPLDHELCHSSEMPKEWHYAPEVYEMNAKERNGHVSTGFSTKTPFNDGNPCEFGQLLVSVIPQLNKSRGIYSDEDVRDLATGCGMVSAFGSALTQAYSQGFSWLQDITYPFTAQSVVFDGKNISFYVYQLNTIELWKTGDKGVPLNNVCWALPETKLFDHISCDEVEGFNDSALKNLMKFFSLKPVNKGINLRPYLNENPRDVESFMNCLSEPVIERIHPPRFFTHGKCVKLKSPIQETHELLDKQFKRTSLHWDEETSRFK